MKGLNGLIMRDAIAALKMVKGAAIMLFIDALNEDGWDAWLRLKRKKDIIIITQSPETEAALDGLRKEFKAIVRLPKARLTRMGYLKLSLIMCITEGLIRGKDKIISVTGACGSGALDTMMVLDVDKETEVFSAMGNIRGLFRHIRPAVLEAALSIAIELSSEGREGRSVGATFVIGDHEKVLGLSRPLIMNPFKGYAEDLRNILNHDMRESIKEYALLDGAFVVREDGVVMSAGVHLDAALEDEGLTPGLGCRHMAAAGITDVTDAAAITISGSTGIVRIFRKGRVVVEIERPQRNVDRPA
ncbi:MAG: diadenylate cyclase [Deltaproteobacteria bacterium]